MRRAHKNAMKYCALCCIAKDEDPFLKEWLAYHALLGFEHFIIYDDLSATPISDFLGDWADADTVTVVRNTARLSQRRAYDHCLENYGNNFKWLAFLDLDEFIRLKANPGTRPDIRLFLAEFEPYAGLGVNWRLFSSAGHEKTPRGPVIANYRQWLRDDIHIKSVVQPARTRAAADPHSFFLKEGEHLVNERRFPIPPAAPFSPPFTERIAVNHYYFKSRQCFEAKIVKGNPCNITRRMEDFDAHLSQPGRGDDALLPFVPELRTALRAPRLETRPLPQCAEPLEAAGDLLRQTGEGADSTEALLLLCQAVLHNEGDAGAPPDPFVGLRIWTLRAMAARQSRDFALAEHCLAQALRGIAERGAYAELASLLAAQGRMDVAGACLDIFRFFE